MLRGDWRRSILAYVMVTSVELESTTVPRRRIGPTHRPHAVGLDSPILLTLLDELREAEADARRFLDAVSAGSSASLDLEHRAVLDRLSLIKANLEALRRL